jgi:predicted dehydrogenase
MISVAVIGCGYWGINYIRLFTELPMCRVVLAADGSEDRRRIVRERFPLITTTSNWEEAVTNRWVDGVIIATPANAHFAITKKALLEGKHVLVEKPITTSTEEGTELIRVAEQQSRVLMVGHTFLYNSGIRKMKELMLQSDFGQVYYVTATRTNMGPIRQDVNALWDLAAHDIAIFNYLLNGEPSQVSGVGGRVLGNERDDVVFATLNYPSGVIANLHVSWIDPNKVREVVAVGSQRRIVFDDLNSLERVRIFEKGVAPELEAGSFGEYRLKMRDGDILSPKVETSEPLKNQSLHFLECMRTGARPLTDAKSGVDVVKVLCAIDQSMLQRGAPVAVPAGTEIAAAGGQQ